MPKPLSNKLNHINDLFANHPSYQPLREFGFTRPNLTSIVGYTSSVKAFVAVANSLVSNLDLIKSIQKSTSFKVSNIATILSNSSQKVSAALEALVENKERLSELTSFGLTTSNISSILAGSSANVGRHLNSLVQHKQTLLELINHGFSGSKISLMLAGPSSNLDQALNGLTQQKDSLIELTRRGLSPSTLGFLLKGRGAKLGEAIVGLAKSKGAFVGPTETKPNKPNEVVDLTRDDQSTASSIDSLFPSWAMNEDLIQDGPVSQKTSQADIWGRSFFETNSDPVYEVVIPRKPS